MAKPHGPEMSDRGSFIERWSRRKRETETEAPVEPAEPVEPVLAAEDPVAESPAIAAEAAPDPELLASLPRIEDITAVTDIRAFLQAGVPQALRNAALRAAWAADPAIAGYRDPAVDYFWDWNAPGGVPGGGGALVPERVAAMARNLLDQPAAAPDAGGEVEAEAVAKAQGAKDPDAMAAAEPSAVLPGPADPPHARDPGPAMKLPEAAAETPSGDGQPEAAGQPVARRRHGGALPG